MCSLHVYHTCTYILGACNCPNVNSDHLAIPFVEVKRVNCMARCKASTVDVRCFISHRDLMNSCNII